MRLNPCDHVRNEDVERFAPDKDSDQFIYVNVRILERLCRQAEAYNSLLTELDEMRERMQSLVDRVETSGGGGTDASAVAGAAIHSALSVPIIELTSMLRDYDPTWYEGRKR